MNRNRWLCYAAVLLLFVAALLWRRNVDPLPADESSTPSVTRRSSSTAVTEEAPPIRHVHRAPLPPPKADIAISSYFESGFGTTFSKKIVFKKSTTTWKGYPRVEWFAVKSKSSLTTEGIQIGFWDNFDKEKLQALIENHAETELAVVGYETIEALGEPERGPDISEPSGDTIFRGSDQGAQPWAVRRKLVIMEIEEASK